MKPYAAVLLRLVLERAQRQDASEVRMISGLDALLVEKSGRVLSAELAHLSQELVRDLHKQCLALAGLDDRISKTSLKYAAVIPRFGRFRCDFRLRGNTASLTLCRDSDDGVTVDAVRPKKRPSLGAAARPEETRRRDEDKH